jgi:hypothetical protein
MKILRVARMKSTTRLEVLTVAAIRNVVFWVLTVAAIRNVVFWVLSSVL